MLKPIRTVSKILIMATMSGMALVPAVAEAAPAPEAVAQAQTSSSARGVVLDEMDEPMIGATVQVANNPSQGGATNIDGEFSIANVKVGTKLKVSAIGYKPVEVVWNGQKLSVKLSPDSQVLEEVVVTAMGIQRKESSLTYATQEIKSDDLMKVQNSNFVNSLNGKVSGVTISQSAGGAGGASKILLRGNKSVMGNNAPLIVVDGIPMTNQVGDASSSYSANWDPTYQASSEGGDALALINPDDIESINVLKGANAAALYGSAAANGVLMITTKKGKEGKITVTVNSGVTFETPLLTPELQTTYGSAIDHINNSIAVDAWGKKLSDLNEADLAFAGAKITNRYRNNVDEFFRTGTSWNNSIAISGGNDKIRTYFSYSNSNANGIIRSNNYNRNTFSFRQSYNMFDNKLRIDVALNYVYAKTKNRAGGGTLFNPIYDLYLTAPNIDMDYYRNNPFRANGTWTSNPHTYFVGNDRVTGTTQLSGMQQIWAYNTARHNNPYWLTDVNRGCTREERAYGYATISYEIIKGLKAQARINLDRAKLSGESSRYATTQSAANMIDYGQYGYDHSESNDVYVDALLSYNNNFNDFSVSATAGWSGHSVSSKWQKIWADPATYYVTSMDKLPTLINFFEPTAQWAGSPVTHGKDNNWDRGLFFTGQVGWRDMVYIEGSYRQDWYRAFRQFTDRGTPDNYGYWSLGGNTLVHRYATLPEFITHLKLRASYSEVGNSIPNVFYAQGDRNLATGAMSGSGYGYFANPRPEKSKSVEAGFDVSFFNNDLSWDLTYYHTDLTNSYFVAPSASGKPTPVNTGLIRNQGIETTISYNVLGGRDWMWKTGFNFSYNDNKIVKTFKNSMGQPARMEQSIANGKILVRYEEGGSYGDMYTLDFRRNEDGSIWLSKNTGTPQLSPRNYVCLGNMNSKFQLGWSNTITWKDLSVYFLINGRIGGKTISLTEAYLDNAGMSKRSGDARIRAEKEGLVWTAPDGTTKPAMYVGETLVPIEEYYKTVGGQIFASDYVYNATNFRLGELSVGYTFRNLLKGGIKSLNLSFVGRNLFFIYKDSPVDPEISLSTKNGMGGVDVFNLPSTRSYGINLKLEF